MTSFNSTVHSLGAYASTKNTPTYQTVVHNLAVHGDIETQVFSQSLWETHAVALPSLAATLRAGELAAADQRADVESAAAAIAGQCMCAAH